MVYIYVFLCFCVAVFWMLWWNNGAWLTLPAFFLTFTFSILSLSSHSGVGWPWTHSASLFSPSRWPVSSPSSGSSTKSAPGCPCASAPASSTSLTSRRWNGTQGDPTCSFYCNDSEYYLHVQQRVWHDSQFRCRPEGGLSQSTHIFPVTQISDSLVGRTVCFAMFAPHGTVGRCRQHGQNSVEQGLECYFNPYFCACCHFNLIKKSLSLFFKKFSYLMPPFLSGMVFYWTHSLLFHLHSSVWTDM